MTSAEEIAAAIRTWQFHYADEDQLQVALADGLAGEGFEVQREVRLNDHDRIDLLVGRVGIEVKVAGATSAVARQCARYLKSDLIDELVLVTNRPRHAAVASALPVLVVNVIVPW